VPAYVPILSTAPPAADSAANATVVDVIGSKLDTHDGTSLYAATRLADEHIHSVQMCHPTAADPIVLTADGVGAGWTDGAWVELAAVGVITEDFDIHGIYVSAPDTNGNYEIDIAAGTTVIGTVPFTRTGPFTGSLELIFQTPIQPAGTQIQARVRTGADGGETCGVKFHWHPY